MKIRSSIFILIMAIGFLTNCENDDDSEIEFESTATITDYDLGFCPCCGGVKIFIDDEDSSRRISELPENSTIDIFNMPFPINVRLNWSESIEYCGKGIMIESWELIE